MVLGPYGVLTLHQARNAARKVIGAVLEGEDPSAQRQETTRPQPLLMSPPAIEEHAKPKKKPWVYRPDHSNPCRHVERYKERKCERYLSAEELARLGEVLAQVEHEQTEPLSALLAIRLLLLTGARKGEILQLTWDEVDFERGYLRLKDSKTGEKTIPLGPAALDLLAEAPTRTEGNPYVCTGARKGQHLVGLQRPWERIREAAGLEDVRIHDPRHTHASVAAGVGYGLPIIGKLLGHSQPVTTARYAHLADDPVREAAGRISDTIASHLDKSSTSVIKQQKQP